MLRSPQIRIHRSSLRIFARRNAALGPRLGMIIGRRAVRRAHERNRLKRVAREAFRLHCRHLPPLDIVLHVQGPLQSGELKRRLDDAFEQMTSEASH